MITFFENIYFNNLDILFINKIDINYLFNFFFLDFYNKIKLTNLSYENLRLANNTNFFIYTVSTEYNSIILQNYAYFLYSVNVPVNSLFSYFIGKVLSFFIKVNIFLHIMYAIFFVVYLGNYIKQLKSLIFLVKGIILNVTEKEVGPVDDYFFFAILFMLTISLFIFSSISLILLQSKITQWALGGFFILMFLILTLPLNLLLDFRINFCVVVRGSAPSNNVIKELLLDIVGTTIIFIRFVTQNIRFLFIFFGIFELLEWTLSTSSSLFITDSYLNNSIIVNWNINQLHNISNFNVLVVNLIMFIIFYLYYFLHLLFLLLVQISIYIGVSIWLFFFLYSTKFLRKNLTFFLKK